MNKIINDFKDELGEGLKDVGRGVVREVKSFGKIAKQQVTGNFDDNKGNKVNENKFAEGELASRTKVDENNAPDKVDPVTGKPQIKKPQLQQLAQATQQLQLAKLKKLREQLEEQRLKVTTDKAKLAPIEQAKTIGQGPAMPTESAEKAPDNAVAKALKGSKSTGEFKGLIGG